jgi:predicted Zn-ribbon and HTH transcriptional regulator
MKIMSNVKTVSKPKTVVYNDNDRDIVAVLKEAGEPMTLAEIGAALGREVKPGTLTSTKNKGLIATADEKKVVMRKANRPVNRYEFITDEAMKSAKGKVKTYTDSEKEILAILKNAAEPMTLAEIAKARGLDKIGAGSVSGLTKAGNIKIADKVKVEVEVEDEVNAYVYVMDVPAATPTNAFAAE